MTKKEKFLKLFKDNIYNDYLLIRNIEGSYFELKHLECNNIYKVNYIKFLQGQRCPNQECILNRKKKTCLEKYGVESVSKLKSTKDKKKKTNIKKYGVDNPLKSEAIKERIKKTNLKKYGHSCSLHGEEISKKTKENNIKKYGVEYPGQNNSIKDKKKKLLLNKYGVGNISQLENVKEKKKGTTLKKYGVQNPSQSKIIKDRIKKSTLKTWGVDNISKSDIIKEKKKESSLKHYGVEHPMQDNSVKNKLSKTSRKDYYIRIIKNLKNVVPLFNLEDFDGVFYRKEYKWKCKKCGNIFRDHLHSHLPRCLKCYPILSGTSNLEKEIKTWLDSYIYNKKERFYYDKNKFYEVDIFIPSKNFGIEINGLYYHCQNSGSKDKKYHINKTKYLKSKNITIIHIMDIEWLNKQEIVKSMIKSKLGLIKKRIYARNCEIEEINNETASTFYENNHIQGPVNSSINIGLFNNNTLVSCISLSKPRFNKNADYEITRFASLLNTSVVGGFSKMMKHISKKLINSKILTYADLRYSNGNVYIKNNFKLLHTSSPNYFYTKDYKTIVSREQFQKHKLKDKLDFFSEDLTEWENMQQNGYDRIWDCGNLVLLRQN